MFLLTFVLSIYIVLCTSSEAILENQKENTTLLLVQALIYHGESAPEFIYKNDPNTIAEWPGGMSMLTLKGKQHHYDIGKFLRFLYKDFLTSNPNEVLVNSSALDRCLTGAEVTVASLYEPDWLWRFEDDFNWQPIPVCYLPTIQDKFLSHDSDCPRAFEELRRLRNSEGFQELNEKYQKMLEEVSNFVDMDISESFKALLLGDTLRTEKLYNLTLPTLIDNYFEDILEYGDATFNCFYGSDIMLRLRVGPLLQAISENMKKKINGSIPDLKFQLYSTQDVIVAAVMNALNFTHMPRPPHCATLLFELHEMTDATIAVRLLYINSSNSMFERELHTLILDDCSEFCPLENFTKKFQHLIPDDWEQECQIDAPADVTNPYLILIITFSVAVCLSIILLVGIYFYAKRTNEDPNTIFAK